MAMWRGERRDFGDRARELADRAGDALRRGFGRMRGDEEDEGWSGHDRGDWRRSGEYGRWGGERYGRSDLGERYGRAFEHDRYERGPTYRPGASVHGGMDDDRYRGYGASGYGRDFGYDPYRSRRDRGFSPDRYFGGDTPRYDRGYGQRGGDWEGGWRGRQRTLPSAFRRGPSGWDGGPERDEWWGGWERAGGWRGGGRDLDELGGYSRGLGDDPYYSRDAFEEGGGRYDGEFRRDRGGDWF